MCKVKDVMPLLQLFVSNILIFLVEAELTSTETGIFNNITPLHYKLDLWPHIEFDYFIGQCRIIIRIEKEIQTIHFLSTASIINAKLNKIDPNVTEHINATYIPMNVIHYSATEVITLHFNEIIERGYYVLEMKYQNNFTDSTETDGFLRTSCMDIHGNKKWMVTTQTRVGCPRAIFPCWNNPRYTTTFEMSINHLHSYMAISNSKVHCFSSSGQGQDMIWTHFQSTPSIFPHCINIVVMPTYYSHKLGYNIRMWTSSNIQYLSQSKFHFTKIIIENVMHYLKTTTNLVNHCKAAYANYIAIKNFSLETITTPSFVLFREEDISVSNTSFSNHKQEAKVALVIVQQMVYQWILQSTNLLAYSVFSWLQDVSKFFTIYILEQVLPELKVYNSPIQSVYKRANFTSFVFNIENIIELIMSSRTPLVSFCDRNFDKKGLSP